MWIYGCGTWSRFHAERPDPCGSWPSAWLYESLGRMVCGTFMPIMRASPGSTAKPSLMDRPAGGLSGAIPLVPPLCLCPLLRRCAADVRSWGVAGWSPHAVIHDPCLGCTQCPAPAAPAGSVTHSRAETPTTPLPGSHSVPCPSRRPRLRNPQRS